MNRVCHICQKPWSAWRIDGRADGLEYRTCCAFTFTVEVDEYGDTEPCGPPSDAEMAAEFLRGTS